MPPKLPQSVVETRLYLKAASKLLSGDQQAEVVDLVASHPTAGDLIRGTGGVRKVRYAPEGRGKSGAFRVIYFFHSPGMPIYLLTIYGKNHKANLTDAQRNALRSVTEDIVRAYKERHHG